MNLLSVLSGNAFVMYNKQIAHEVSVNAAILFGQLCSSYESFASKNMLTSKDGKEYFYLTTESIQEETALSYYLQKKALDELERAGYIESKIMGVGAKKYFHITNKIVELLSRSKENKNLNEQERQEENQTNEDDELFNANFRFQKDNEPGFKNVQTKVLKEGKPHIKIKKEKEINKNINNNFVNKEGGNKNQEIIDKLIFEYMNKGLSKKVCFLVLKEVEATPNVQNFGGYLRTCLENTLYKSQVRNGLINPYDRFKERNKNSTILFYDWLSSPSQGQELIDDDELPY